MEVLETTVTTPVAGVAPKLTVLPAVKSLPVMVTVPPPAVGPDTGLTAVTVGAPISQVSER